MTEDQKPAHYDEVEMLDAEPGSPKLPRHPGRLTARDWAAVTGLLLAAGLSLGVVVSRWAELGAAASPPLLISTVLSAVIMTLTGALLAYVAMRRRLLDIGQVASELISISRQYAAVYKDTHRLVEDAYRAGASDGQAAYQDLLEVLDETQGRADELERQLAARQDLVPSGPDLGELTKQIREMEQMVAHLQTSQAPLPDKIAEVNERITAITVELDQLQAHRVTLDAIDEQILALLTEDPTTTDDEISRHPKVAIDRSQVTRRRNRLAAAGYRAAQKRQGQRPGRR